MKITAISFGFENCESADVPIEHVRGFSLNSLSKSLFFNDSNGVREYDVIVKLYVGFKDSIKSFTGETQLEGQLFTERLCKYADVCWFGLVYEDGSRKDYMVEWTEGSSDYENLGQYVREDFGLELFINYPKDDSHEQCQETCEYLHGNMEGGEV